MLYSTQQFFGFFVKISENLNPLRIEVSARKHYLVFEEAEKRTNNFTGTDFNAKQMERLNPVSYTTIQA